MECIPLKSPCKVTEKFLYERIFRSLIFHILLCSKKIWNLHRRYIFRKSPSSISPKQPRKNRKSPGHSAKTAVSSVIEILQFRHSVVILLPHR